MTSTSTKIRIKNVLKPKVQKTTSTDIVSSPKKHVETLLEKNIAIPQHDFTSLKSNETFDDFILFKQEYMTHPDNQKKNLKSKNDDLLLSFLSIKFTNKQDYRYP